jgi:hypothetical protein
MRGVHNLSLYNKIPPSQFRFLIGLICKANSLGFKTVMEITNSDAMGLGGGNSRQAVNQLRNGLCKFKIDDVPILEVEHGSHFKNISAKYKINYGLLVENGSFWQKGTPSPSTHPSRNPSRDFDGSLPVTLTDPLTTPRSEEKRGEEDHHTTVNKVTTGEGGEKKSENGGGGIFANGEKPEEEYQEIHDELRYHRVREPERSEIAKAYDTRYIYRQIGQIEKDFDKGIVFDNPGGALVARIRKGHTTEDYPG